MFLTPRWIASHVFVLALVVSFVGAGVWQLARLGQRQDENTLVSARMGAAQPYSFALASDADSLEYVRIQIDGQFDPEHAILIANRTADGTPGFWMWSNFITSTGDDVLVNRGFVSRAVVLEQVSAFPLADAAPTLGPVTIEGLLRVGLDGGRVSEDGTQLSRPDARTAVAVLELSPRLDPGIYVELDAQDPSRSVPIPDPVPPPDLGEGPHRSYAFQWFTFATIGALGYTALLVRIRRGDQAKGDVPHDVAPSASAPPRGV